MRFVVLRRVGRIGPRGEMPGSVMRLGAKANAIVLEAN